MQPLIPTSLSSTGSDSRKKIAIFGSTGSIGASTLSIIDQYPDLFEVTALVAGKNKDLLLEQAKKYNCKNFGLASDAVSIAQNADYDLMIAGIVGIAGLLSVCQAAKRGKQIALANKESLVCGGKILSDIIIKNKAVIYPIDSEHSAIWQSIIGNNYSDIKSVILAASGGPFFKFTQDQLLTVTKEQALKHPKWVMGSKVTIDSSTLFNKALEVIEAHWLFGLKSSQIEVIVHPEHIIHSMVRYVDGSVIMQAALPDMRVCIGYAMGFPDKRLASMVDHTDFASIGSFNFFEVPNQKFPAISLARNALDEDDSTAACVVLNAANEVAVEKFLADKISWSQIYPTVESIYGKFRDSRVSSIDDILDLDKRVRAVAEQ
jgi:1-deoxy-D-xylulose-5-phosphate reductoisomerase